MTFPVICPRGTAANWLSGGEQRRFGGCGGGRSRSGRGGSCCGRCSKFHAAAELQHHVIFKGLANLLQRKNSIAINDVDWVHLSLPKFLVNDSYSYISAR